MNITNLPCISIKDHAALVSLLYSIIKKDWIKTSLDYNKGILLDFKINCGCRKQYLTFKDLPKSSSKCRHGNWFIKYDK